MAKRLPKRAPKLTPKRSQKLSMTSHASHPKTLFTKSMFRIANFCRSWRTFGTRQEELAQLNRELEDTNRGVVALYAELDEKAEHLKQADRLKSTFLSHMSHEFRTPLNSIMALSKILLDRLDGPLDG